MIIDVHTHIFEEKMWAKKFLDELRAIKKKTLTPEGYERYTIGAKTEALIKDMDSAGIDVSVCLPIDFAFMCQQEPEISIRKANEYVAEAQQKYPDRIVGFCGVDPMRADAIDILEWGVKELGLRGVKIFPGIFYPNEERVAPFMQKIEELNVPVLFHQGADPLPYVLKYGDPRYIDDLLLKYPRFRVIAAHLARGYGDLLFEMAAQRPGRLWMDVSTCQYEFHYSKWHLLMRLRLLMDRLPNAVLLGTDWPFIKNPPLPSHKDWLDFLRNMELPKSFLDMGMKQFTKEEKEKLLGENAKSLLNLK